MRAAMAERLTRRHRRAARRGARRAARWCCERDGIALRCPARIGVVALDEGATRTSAPPARAARPARVPPRPRRRWRRATADAAGAGARRDRRRARAAARACSASRRDRRGAVRRGAGARHRVAARAVAGAARGARGGRAGRARRGRRRRRGAGRRGWCWRRARPLPRAGRAAGATPTDRRRPTRTTAAAGRRRRRRATPERAGRSTTSCSTRRRPRCRPALLAQLRSRPRGRGAARAGGAARAARDAARVAARSGSRRGDLRGGARLERGRDAACGRALAAAAPARRRRGIARRPPPRRRVRRGGFPRHPLPAAARDTTTIFVVDASGSAALHRLAEAKGAVELLLAECYVRRDQVALIAFRGRGAELLLPPTRSLVRAKRSLAALPGGGGTPLAAGIDAAVELAELALRRGETPIVVVLTDGRANVARDGTGGRARAATTRSRRRAACGTPGSPRCSSTRRRGRSRWRRRRRRDGRALPGAAARRRGHDFRRGDGRHAQGAPRRRERVTGAPRSPRDSRTRRTRGTALPSRPASCRRSSAAGSSAAPTARCCATCTRCTRRWSSGLDPHAGGAGGRTDPDPGALPGARPQGRSPVSAWLRLGRPAIDSDDEEIPQTHRGSARPTPPASGRARVSRPCAAARCARRLTPCRRFTRYVPRVPAHGPMVTGEDHGVAAPQRHHRGAATACAAAARSARARRQ